MKEPKKNKAEKATQKEQEPLQEQENPQPTEQELLQTQLDEKQEQLLLLAAEYDNFRKRSQREKEELYQVCKADVVSKFLEVLDNFDRAQQVQEASYADYRKGVDMTYAQFVEVLGALEVQAFGEVGEEFDPTRHNAVLHIEDEALPKNSIAQVFSKGYQMGNHIIREATVQVAN